MGRGKIMLPSLLGILMVTFLAVYKTPSILRELDYHQAHSDHMDRFALRLPPLSNHRLIDQQARRDESSPRLLEQVVASAVGNKDESIGRWNNPHNVVHVINTQMMQSQADLVHLGRARMGLFKTFTLPSIRQQTNSHFLWIIWTDPKLEKGIKDDLIENVKGLSNVVVLGAEAKPLTDFRSLYGLIHSIRDIVVAGEAERLVDYWNAAKTRLLIETNLDADDGLSKNYVESVQRQTVDSMGMQQSRKSSGIDNEGSGAQLTGQQQVSDATTKVEVLCPERHLEWRYYKPKDEGHWKGHLMQFRNGNGKDGLCGTHSGTSIVYHINGTASQLEDSARNSKHTVSTRNKGTTKQKALPICDEGQHGSTKKSKRRRKMVQCEGRGKRKYEYIREQAAPEHLEACPAGSFMCESPMHSSLGGPTFTVPSQIVTCHVMGQQRRGLLGFLSSTPASTSLSDDIVRAKVTPIKYEQGTTKQSRFEVDILSDDYWLAAIHLRSEQGASLYTWNDDDETGAVAFGTFSTPRERPLHHIDICVIPRDKVCDKGSPEADDTVQNSVGESRGPPSNTPYSADEVKKLSPFPVCQRTLSLLNFDTLAPTRNYLQTGVILSKTPTASGMQNVLPTGDQDQHDIQSLIPEKTFESPQAQGHAWVILEHDFGVDPEDVSSLREDFEANIELILVDAMKGQCDKEERNSPACLNLSNSSSWNQRQLFSLFHRFSRRKRAKIASEQQRPSQQKVLAPLDPNPLEIEKLEEGNEIVSVVWRKHSHGGIQAGPAGREGENIESPGEKIEVSENSLDSKLRLIEEENSDNFNSFGSPDLHHPLVFVNRTLVEVGVPHPMTPTHFIQYMWLRDANTSQLVAARKLKHSDSLPILVSFVPPGTTLVRAFVYCNQHGVWTTGPVGVKHRKKIPFYNRDHAKELKQRVEEEKKSKLKKKRKKIPLYNKIKHAQAEEAIRVGA